jgi:hypothetical protein
LLWQSYDDLFLLWCHLFTVRCHFLTDDILTELQGISLNDVYFYLNFVCKYSVRTAQWSVQPINDGSWSSSATWQTWLVYSRLPWIKFYTKTFRIVYILIFYLLIMFIWVVFICA